MVMIKNAKYASFEFRVPVGGTGSQGNFNKLNGSFALAVPNASNVLIDSIYSQAWIDTQYSAVTGNSNGNAGRPYYSARFLMMSNKDFLRQQRGLIYNDFDTDFVFKGGLDEIQMQVSNDSPILSNLDLIGSGLTLIQAGFMQPNTGSGTNWALGITIKYYDLLDC